MGWVSALSILALVSACSAQSLVEQTCVADKSYVDIGTNVNVRIGGLYEMRQPGANGYGCDKPVIDLMQVLEASKFAISAINAANYIPGVTFGMRVYDTCRQASVTLKALQEMYPQTTANNPFCVQGNTVLLGSVGPMSSSTSIPAAKFASSIPASLVSPRAMAPALSDKIQFPSFLRTTPSNAVFGRVVVELLKTLQWEKSVLVVYSDNAYGRSGYQHLLQAAHERGVCISRAVALDPSLATKDEVKAAITASVGSNAYVAGVVVADHDETALVLQAVEEISTLSSTQWILSNLDITSDLSSVPRARGAMVVFPSSKTSNDFKTYFAQQENNLSPGAHADNPWFLEWYEAKYNCKMSAPFNGQPQCTARGQANLEASFVQSPWALPTMKAIAAYVEAVRLTCQGTAANQCAGRLLSVSHSNFLTTLKNLDVTFPPTFPISSLRGERVRFDANGDLDFNDFTIYSYNNRDGTYDFDAIGDFTNNVLTLGQTPVLYTSSRAGQLATNPVAPCSVTAGCTNCLRPERSVTLRYTPGDVVIGTLADGHMTGRAPFTCGDGVPSHLAALVAAEWAAAQFKQSNPGKLNQVTVGSLAADVCSDGFVAGGFLADLLSESNRLTTPTGTVIRATNIYGFVDQTDGRQGQAIHPILASHMIPEIQTESVMSMMMREDSPAQHPYMIQAVSNDDTLHDAISAVLIAQNWRYVQIVTHGSGMYQHAAHAFRRNAGRHGICVVDVVDTLDSQDNNRFSSAVSRLLVQSDAKVVVVIADMDAVRGLLRAIETQGAAGQLQLVAGTEAWATNPDYVRSLGAGAEGSLVVGLEMSPLTEFSTWLRALTQAEIAAHPFLRELFEVTNQCSLGPTTRVTYTQACGATHSFNTNTNSPILNGKTPYVIQSVFTMADKLHEVIAEVCGAPNYSGLCPQFRAAMDIGSRLDAKLRNTNKADGFGIKDGKSTTNFNFYQYRGGNYNRFAVYNTEDSRMSTYNTGALAVLPATTCAGPCVECQYLFTLQNGLYVPGDWLIGALFSISNPDPVKSQPYVCGDIRTSYGPQFSTAMSYALQQVNSGAAPVSVKGMKIGGITVDHCDTSNRANLLLSSVYANYLNSMVGEDSRIISWMTDTTSSTQEAQDLLDPLGVAVVSPSATSSDLLDVSTFHRTVQGDQTVASALVKMIKTLGYTYFQVVHSSSGYGRGGLEALTVVAQSEGMCVTRGVEMTDTSQADSIVASLVSEDTNVVVFYTGKEDMQAIMDAVVRSQDARDSLFILLAEPFDSLVATVAPQLKHQVMSLRLETGVLPNYNAYLNSAPVANPYFAQYYMKVLGCNLPGYNMYTSPCPDNLPDITSAAGYTQDNFVLATINAVYATVDALDRTVREYCGDSYTQPCAAFQSAPDKRKRFNDNLANVNFVDEAGNNFKFIGREGNVVYNILQSRRSGSYAKVGSFAGITLNLDGADTTGYSDVKSECAAPCLSCVMQALEFSHTPGDVYLGGVFDVHESSVSPFLCGGIKTLHGFLLLEAFHYALEQVNSKTGQFANILSGVKLGGIGVDACNSKIRGGYLISNIHNGYFTLARDGHRVLPSMIDTYIGSYGSRASIYLAQILNDLEIPQISYAAGNPGLSDERHYPYFYRTVPSDNNMVEAILKFLDKMDIRYVQVVFEETANAIATKDYFEKMASRYSICVAQAVNYPDISTISAETANAVVARLLEKPAANTVVTFLDSRMINSMLQAILRSDRARDKLRFVGSDDWADNQEAILLTGQQAINSITVKLDSDDVKGFEDYINSRTLANTKENPWFEEYYQRIHNCYTQRANTMGYPRQCPQTPSDTINQPNYQQDQGVVYVMDAVYAAAFALHEAIEDKCGEGYTALCQAYRNSESRRDLVRDKLRDVNFTDPVGSKFNFIDRSGNYGYRYYSIDAGVRGVAAYNQIGTFDAATKDIAVDSSYRNKVNSNCERKDACAECPLIRDNSLRYVIYNGPRTLPKDANTIVAFFDIHHQGLDPYRCGSINPHGFQQFLAFFYTIEKVLQETVTGSAGQNGFRVVAIDTCSNSLRVDQDLFGILTGDGLCNSNFDTDITLRLGNLGSVITLGDLNTMAASRVLERPGVPYISPNAFSPMLDRHGHLVRTIAPDSATLQALLDLVKRMGWTYVDTVYQMNAGSSHMLDAMLQRGSNEGLCVASSVAIDDGDSNQNIEASLSGLSSESGSKVVFLIGSHKFARAVLQAASGLGVADDYLWVLWGHWEPTPESIASLGVRSSVQLLTVYRRTWEVPTFTQHVNQIQRGDLNIPTQWFDEFFQMKFNCTIPTSQRPLGGGRGVCDTSKSLSESQWSADPFVLNTVAAAYAAGTGIRAAVNSCNNPPCATTSDQIRDAILNVRWNMLDTTLGNDFANNGIRTELQFDKANRWWNQGHVFRYWGDQAQGGQETFTTEELDGLRNSLAEFTDSGCSESLSQGYCGCPLPDGAQTSAAQGQLSGPGYTPSDHRNYYRYRDSGEKTFDWPLWALPVGIFTAIGIVTTLILFLILICSYPVRGGTSVLGYMVILGIVCIYGINFAFFLHATDAVCGIRRFLMGTVYMIVLAPLLVKAVDNWRYSHVDYAEGRYSGISSACSLLSMAFGLVLVQCIIPIMWLILEHPTATTYIWVDGRHDNWWCDPPGDYDLGLVLSFAFVLFVVFITAGFSALAYDSGRNCYESRWILFCCICTGGCFLVWMVVTTNAGPPYRDPAVAIANAVNATLLLICMPLRKACLMWRANDEEEKDVVMARNGDGVPYAYNGTYDNPTYELNGYDNTFMDSKSEEF